MLKNKLKNLVSVNMQGKRIMFSGSIANPVDFTPVFVMIFAFKRQKYRQKLGLSFIDHGLKPVAIDVRPRWGQPFI